MVRDLLSQLGLDSSAVFERMKSRFTLQDGVIRMDAIHVESPLLQLVGSGKLDLDGRLEHDLQVRYSLVDRLGPLTRMLYWVQNNLLSISVRGDMARPQIVLKGMLSFLRSGSKANASCRCPLSPLPERFSDGRLGHARPKPPRPGRSGEDRLRYAPAQSIMRPPRDVTR